MRAVEALPPPKRLGRWPSSHAKHVLGFRAFWDLEFRALGFSGVGH